MSFKIPLSKRRRTYVRLIGDIQHVLNQALSEEHAARGLTRAGIAAALGKDKSFVTRKLTGEGNMTLETLADFAFALDRSVQVFLPRRTEEPGRNDLSNAAPSTSATTSTSGDKILIAETAA